VVEHVSHTEQVVPCTVTVSSQDGPSQEHNVRSLLRHSSIALSIMSRSRLDYTESAAVHQGYGCLSG